MFPALPGFQVPAGTNLFRKFPVAVEVEVGNHVEGSVESALLWKLVLYQEGYIVMDVPLGLPVVCNETLASMPVGPARLAADVTVAVPGLVKKGTWFIVWFEITQELFFAKISHMP